MSLRLAILAGVEFCCKIIVLGALAAWLGGCTTPPPVDAEYLSTPCVECCLAQLVWGTF